MVELSTDALSVVFRHTDTLDLGACAATCREWRVHALHERGLRVRMLADLAFKWVRCNPGQLVVAGSMAMWLAAGGPTHWFPGDADVFFHGGCDDSAVRHSPSTIVEQTISCDDVSISFEVCEANFSSKLADPRVVTHDTKAGKLQFVLSTQFATPAAVLDSFDLSCCMIGYTAPNEPVLGPRYASPAFTSYIAGSTERCSWMYASKREYTFRRLLSATQRARTEARVQKYVARGYTHHDCVGEVTHDQMVFSTLYVMSCSAAMFRYIGQHSGGSVACICSDPSCDVEFTV